MYKRKEGLAEEDLNRASFDERILAPPYPKADMINSRLW